ncbi:hypothetical protein niasHS_005636 [Heterodera schachtii]|uniref:Uncharacterized protein n=1 Tax=Heterodera schachtii TaxID=97005 RepID=A0ABD2JZ49_HETSC
MTVPLVGNGAKNGQHFGTKKAPSQRLRSIFSWVSKFNQNSHIVKLYQKMKNTPGGWGQLIRKIYAEMLSAKKLGVGDSKPLRDNCHKALQLIGEGRAVQRVDVQKIKPFRDFWTLLKNSALSLVALFKGTLKTKNGRESDRKMRRENILRALKTFSTADNSFFLRMVRKNGKTDETHKDQKRRRQKRLAPLIIFGIIIGGLLVIAFLSEWGKAAF